MLQSLLVEYKYKGSHLQSVLMSQWGRRPAMGCSAVQVHNACWPLSHLSTGTAETNNAVANANSVRASETMSFHAGGSRLLNTFIPEKAGNCL